VLLLILVIVLAIAGRSDDCSAFSFEGIDIQSKFGERFRAELSILLEENDEFQVQIGDKDDYQRLELERPRIIDDLKIVIPDATEEGRRTIQVVSGRPLFFPSFNLIIRGTSDGGTLLENYLVAVDFQQNLALNVQEGKKQSPETIIPSPKKEVDLLKGGGAAADSTTSMETQKELVADGEGGVPLEVADEEGPSGIPPRVDAPSWMGKPPAQLKGVRGRDTYFPGATWVSQKETPDKMPPFNPSELPKEVEEEMTQVPRKESAPSQAKTVTPETLPPDLRVENSSSPGLGYGPLARGENLFSIAKKLDTGESDLGRVAVALWMENPDSFMYGNMNGIKEGSRLNLENLKQRLEDIESKMAREVLGNQWQEWKVIREKLSVVENEVFDGMAQEIPLPSENEDEKKMIFEMLRYWKESWEKGDLDQHLTHFAN
jgi:Tfp pilus assembly protein FimV